MQNSQGQREEQMQRSPKVERLSLVKEVKEGRCSWVRVELGDRDQVRESSEAYDQLVTCDCGPGSHGDL